jgi:DNA recombination protein RmuC
MQVEKNAREILANLKRLTSDFEKFKEDYVLVGRHLSNAKSKFEDSERRLEKFEDKLIQSGHGEEQTLLLN